MTRVHDPEKLRRLLSAFLMIAADLELADLLTHLVEEARSLVGARYCALGVLDASRKGLEQFVTAGMTPDQEAAIGPRPAGRGVLGVLISDPRPLRVADLASHPRRFGFPPGHPPMTSFLGCPVLVRGEVYGNLYLTDKVGADAFTAEDEALAEALAQGAGIAIENARLHRQAREMTVFEERDRIARDLHDRVIQRIFSVGLALEGATRQPERDELVARVVKAQDDLDGTIAEIRSAIFELGEGGPPGGLRRAVLELAEELAPGLGGRPSVTFSGPVDTSVPAAIAGQVPAVLREALTNVARHAGATRCAVELEVSDHLRLVVTDDGAGLAPPAGHRGLGLGNLERRARDFGGTMEIQPAYLGGTRLVWTVPLP